MPKYSVVLILIISSTILVKIVESNKRCGTTSAEAQRIKRYVLMNHMHVNDTITYKITDYSKHLSKADVDSTIDLAFKLWESKLPSKFVKLDSRSTEVPDIELRFAVGNHGECPQFDGPGNILAHALKNYVHFDDDETWKTSNDGEGTDLLSVATHEIGHSLGLEHTNVEEAIMFPWYTHTDKFELHDDDIQGLQEIYGLKNKTNRLKLNLDLCKDPIFDVMFKTPDGKVYILKSDVYYELNGLSIIAGPKKISSTWKELPTDINAAFSQNGKTFFFKNGKYWRYTGYKLDVDYPERINKFYSEIPDVLDTAFVANDESVYFFRGSRYFRIKQFDESYTNVTRGKIGDILGGIPNHLDAAFYQHKQTFFFKDGFFYILLDNSDKPGYEIPISTFFFDC